MTRKVTGVFLSVLILMAGLSGAAFSREMSQDWASFQVNDRYVVMNNVWGKVHNQNPYVQKIVDEKGYFGWTWDWKGEGQWVLAYPEVMCGDSPWNEDKNLHPGFPFKAGSKKMTVDFDIDLNTTGKCDMAFEFWALSALPSKKENISQEVMIWNLDKTGGSWGWADNLGTFKSEGITYDVYYKGTHGDDSGANENKWTYIAFVAQTPFMKGKLKVHDFIDFLIRKKLMTKDNYIANFELGNEIWDGTGTAKIKKYEVTVE